MTFSATATTASPVIDGLYTVWVFHADDTLVCTESIEAEVLVVAGGGGGSEGGGGGGGYLTGAQTLTGSMPVVVGGGGAGAAYNVAGNDGGDSSFGTRSANGGGGGGAVHGNGRAGGSSGGGGGSSYATTTSPAATPSGQGHAGGGNAARVASPYPAAGGGGAAAAGADAPGASTGGNGGAGINSDIVLRGSNVGYSGGGGGGTHNAGTAGTATHGGGNGNNNSGNGSPGADFTGGGGGGAGNGRAGGSGGAGIVVVRYLTPPEVDRAVTLDEAMCDLATLSGLATVTRAATIGSSRDQLALRPEFEKSIADGLRELAAMHSASVEQLFDRAAGAWRFTCNETPAAVDQTRNRHWVLDDSRPGENTSGIVRDPEATPEYLRVVYLSSGVASLPNGTPRSYCYPSEPPDFTANVIANTDQADVQMTDAQAADVAQRLFDQLNAASFSGTAQLPEVAITASGQELPSRLMRPGDRVNILGRDGATDLYVSETSYDWSSGQLSATVGWPFDVKAARRELPRRHIGRPGGLSASGWSGGLRPHRSWRR